MRAAPLRLSFYQVNGTCLIDVNVGDAGPVRLKGCSREEARGVRAELGDRLREARGKLGDRGGRVELKAAYECLHVINRAGMNALQRLLGPDQTALLESCVRDAIPNVDGEAHHDADFPIVEIDMQDSLIQFEALPLGRMAKLVPFESDRDLVNAATRFAGFSCVTRRLTSQGAMSQDYRLAGHPLPMKMFRHVRFPGSDREAEALERDFALDGGTAWPDVPGCTVDAAVEAMVHCDLTFRRERKSTVDQIHHFSCHSQPCKQGAYLELQAANDHPIRIIPPDFNAEYLPASRTQSYPRPLAFLNACETNREGAEGFATWTTTFMQAKYRAVIGTEAPVPDVFASEFSQTFYGELLAQRSVGQALQRAKWKLLKRWKNPMGLLYTLVGNPDLRVG